MSMLGRWLSRLTAPERPSRRGFWGIFNTPAGVTVSEDVALTYSAVWACVRYITDSVAQLPWQVRRRTDAGSELFELHPVYRLLHDRPSPEVSPFSFKQFLLQSALLWGNGYAEIARDRAGRPAMLFPIAPDRVRVDRLEGELIYRISAIGSAAAEVVLPARDVFHLIGPYSLDGGITGLSPVAYAAKSIGLGLAMERFGATFFGNGAHPGGVLQHPGVLDDQAREQLRESLRSRYAGPNANTTMILEEGMTWHQATIPPEDAQFLESRQFSVIEMCRWFGVPPHKIADLTNATYSNIEHQAIEVVTDTLMPWVLRLEQEADYKLLTARDSGVYTKINVGGLLRGDSTARANYYRAMFSMGAMSPNDIRRLEDMNDIDAGDQYLVQVNLTTLQNVVNVQPSAGLDGDDETAPVSGDRPEPMDG